MASRLKMFTGILCSAIAVIVILLLAVRLPDSDGKKIYALGLSAVESGDWSAVSRCADELAALPDYAAQAAMLSGFERKARGRLEQALLDFSKANQHPDTREDSYQQGGAVCYDLKHYQDCIRLLRQVLAWNPDRLDAHKILAAAYYDIGAMGLAISSLEQVVRLSPKDHKPHYMWATILLESERFSDALAEFRTAAELAPPETAMADEIRAAWGNCLIRLRRYEEALEVMTPAHDTAEIQALRSQSLFSLRRFEESQACAEDSIRQQPEQIEAALILAQLYDRSGEQQQGITLLRRLLSGHSAELRLHQRLGELLAATGQTEESLIHRNLAGEIAELRRQFSDAHQQAAVDPDNAELRLKLAQLAEKLGKTDLAQGWYQAALGLSPGNKTIQEQWQQFQSRHFQSSPAVPKNYSQPNASYNEPPPVEF